MRPYVVLWVAICAQTLPQLTTAAESSTVVSYESVSYPRQPQLAVVDDTTIFLAFGSGETVYLCESSDGGHRFGDPIEVGRLPKLALGMRRGPRVVANKDSVLVTAISHQTGDLMAWTSSDHGGTWSGPIVVSDIPETAREGLHGMAIGPDGSVFCCWLDLRHGRTQIYGSKSSDGGRTWTKNQRVYQSPSGTVCECCHPSVAIDEKGTIHVMWRNVVDGDRDMFVADSTDGGDSFTVARKLGTGTWNLDACPMDGGDLAVASTGNITSVWRRNKQIYLADESSLNERLLGFGEQPSITRGKRGPFILWLARRGGDLLLLKPNSASAETIASHANDPVISAARTPTGRIVAAWETGIKPNTAIKSMVIEE